MSNLDKKELEKLRNIFNDCDHDENDQIDWDEFRCMLDKLLGEKTLEEKLLAFHLVDTNHDGMINFEEFCRWWGNQ